MEAFWEFAKLSVIIWGILIGLFMILLSIPKSPFKKVVLKVISWLFFSATLLLGLYILSPFDFLPDIVPIIGQVDDGAALISAIFTGVAGLIAQNQAKDIIIDKKLPDNRLKSENEKLLDQ